MTTFTFTDVRFIGCAARSRANPPFPASQTPTPPAAGPLANSTEAALTAVPISNPTNVPPPATASTGSQPAATTLDGQALLQERCTVCHNLNRVTSAHKTADQWTTTVEKMVGKGAQLDAQEQQTLIDYLAQTYP